MLIWDVAYILVLSGVLLVVAARVIRRRSHPRERLAAQRRELPGYGLAQVQVPHAQDRVGREQPPHEQAPAQQRLDDLLPARRARFVVPQPGAHVEP